MIAIAHPTIINNYSGLTMLLILFKLGTGNFQSGFSELKLQLWEKDTSIPIQLGANLSANLQLSELYQRWQSLYRAISQININRNDNFDIEFDDNDITQVSDQEFQQISEQLKDELNLWLKSPVFASLEAKLRSFLNLTDEIRFVIETEAEELRRFPWHLWDFFDDYQAAEIALSASEYGRINTISKHTNKVRILAILGNSKGINLEEDKLFLNTLPDTELIFLVEPSRSQLNEFLWDEKGWDILFFAGHSWSENNSETGYLAINSQDNLTIPQLKNALKNAINHGLKLAIFNCCDGLGLAKQLASLHIPQMIVMRFDVPDLVAQTFLKHFLQGFSHGKSFYLAVRKAREKLQGLEDQFPCASWLPVICQNPTHIPPNWTSLTHKSSKKPSQYLKLSRVLTISLIVSLLVMGIRWLGFFQSLELTTFDYFMGHKPTQSADSRLLIIGADEDDININNYGYPLPDLVLLQLLQQLQSYQPRAIAIDIFRDQPTGFNNSKDYQKLTTYLKENPHIITVCNLGNKLNQSVAPPQNIPTEQIGYADLYDDSALNNNQDDTIRRYLLTHNTDTLTTPSRCQTDYSLAWHLAYKYLINQGINVETVGDNWQFGSVIFKPLENRSGGYQKLDSRGNQLLINYRNTSQIAQQLTIKNVLEEKQFFNPNLVKDKIVLIGITADSVPDLHDTPLGEIRGIYIHAQVVSQILDAVETKGQNLLWWFPQWGDLLFISFWGLTGGLIQGNFQRRIYQFGAINLAVLILFGGSLWCFTQRLWLPLIPANSALFCSVILVEMKKNIIYLPKKHIAR